MVMGLLTPTTGTIDMDLDDSELPGVVFQRPALLEWRTALQNVLLPAEIGRRSSTAREVYTARARELLQLVGLTGFEEKYPAELSGGMAQRVAIARALLMQSKLLCLDEPFSALDEFTREQMNEQLLRIWASEGLSCLFVTHNLFEAVFLSDRIVVMATSPGRVLAEVTVPLPRPRTREMITSALCVDTVAEIRSLLHMEYSNAPATTSARKG
jgi:NitT/TauT family transport system ATP-binding protein